MLTCTEDATTWGLVLDELKAHELRLVTIRYDKALEVGAKVLDRFGVYREVALIIETDDDGNLYAELIDY